MNSIEKLEILLAAKVRLADGRLEYAGIANPVKLLKALKKLRKGKRKCAA